MLTKKIIEASESNKSVLRDFLLLLRRKASRKAYLESASDFLGHGYPDIAWAILSQCCEQLSPHCAVTQDLIKNVLEAGGAPTYEFRSEDASDIGISIVICSWNRAEMLKDCLEQIKTKLSTHDRVEILVVDNGSTDDSVLVAREAGVTEVYAAEKNAGLEIYRNAFDLCKGELIIEIDDDVIELPQNFDQIFLDYFDAFPDYGFLGMNVVQDSRTNGAKPDIEHYTMDQRGEMTIERGPVVGCCAAIKRATFDRINRFEGIELSMSQSEDGVLCARVISMGLGAGIIHEHRCLHACGPTFSLEYGYLERDIEKYRMSGMTEMAAMYEGMRRT